MDKEKLKNLIQSIKDCKTNKELEIIEKEYEEIIEKEHKEIYNKGYDDGYGGCPEGDPECDYPSGS
jgi:flagellar biosynthesis/type III secretory pathway protein FliH